MSFEQPAIAATDPQTEQVTEATQQHEGGAQASLEERRAANWEAMLSPSERAQATFEAVSRKVTDWLKSPDDNPELIQQLSGNERAVRFACMLAALYVSVESITREQAKAKLNRLEEMSGYLFDANLS